ncbi:MAG TPA: helix-hairpin-helix domain-containing protein [Candidatus Angelobacter sp.]|nr:helix-hairpin-helix domain-containing protein [Candidatus Angelobacter sp.]
MKVLSFLGAVGLGIFSGAWIIALRRRSAAQKSLININEASQEDIMQLLGLDSYVAEQIVEHRPYPSKLDLLGRMVVTPDLYNSIKNNIVCKAS